MEPGNNCRPRDRLKCPLRTNDRCTQADYKRGHYRYACVRIVSALLHLFQILTYTGLLVPSSCLTGLKIYY